MWFLLVPLGARAANVLVVPTGVPTLGQAAGSAHDGDIIRVEDSDQLLPTAIGAVTLECVGSTVLRSEHPAGTDVHGTLTVTGCEIRLADAPAFHVGPGDEITLHQVNVDRDRSVALNGSAVVCDQGTVTVTSSRFASLQGRSGAAVSSSRCTVRSTDSVYEQLSASSEGGALRIADGSLTSTNDTFRNDAAVASGGAIRATTHATVTLDGDVFVGNTTDDHGAAVAVDAVELDVLRTRFCWNHAPTFAGGAIYGSQDSTVDVQNSQFLGNTTGEWGAVRLLGGSISVAQATFVANEAQAGAAAVYLNQLENDDVLSLRSSLFTRHDVGTAVIGLTVVQAGPVDLLDDGAYLNTTPALVDGLPATGIEDLASDPLTPAGADPWCEWIRTRPSGAGRGATEGAGAPALDPLAHTGLEGDADTDADTDSDSAADPDLDTAGPVVRAAGGGEPDPGCGCATPATPGSAWALALALAWRRAGRRACPRRG